MTQPNLLTFLDQLRSKGVRAYRGEFDGKRIEVELGPEVTQDAPGPATVKPEEPTLCRCGCAIYEHTNGLCLKGCEPEACAGPEES